MSIPTNPPDFLTRAKLEALAAFDSWPQYMKDTARLAVVSFPIVSPVSIPQRSVIRKSRIPEFDSEGAQAKPAEAASRDALEALGRIKQTLGGDLGTVDDCAVIERALASPQPAEVPALTDEQIDDIAIKNTGSGMLGHAHEDWRQFARAILRAALAPQLALKEGGEE